MQATRDYNLAGKTFGRWTVLERAGSSKGRGAMWLCRCICGKEKTVIANSLRRGASRSCGCLVLYTNRSNLLPEKTLALNTRRATYRYSAKQRGYEWAITDVVFKELLSSACYYCGTIEKIGIDRADNSEGYTEENCRPCCTTCNLAKREMTEEEFLVWVERIYLHTLNPVVITPPSSQ